jgi:hypothetical protein
MLNVTGWLGSYRDRDLLGVIRPHFATMPYLGVWDVALIHQRPAIFNASLDELAQRYDDAVKEVSFRTMLIDDWRQTYRLVC